MLLNISTQRYGGSLFATSFPGGVQTIYLNAFSSIQSGLTLDTVKDVMKVGASVTIGVASYTMRGSGYAQPGISLFGIPAPTGTAKDLVLLQNASTGALVFVYPEGPPNALGMIALMVSVKARAYNAAALAPVCFVTGKRIATARGLIAVEEIRPGDLVLDPSGGPPNRALWRGRSAAPPHGGAGRPILIREGAFGPGRPLRDLRVSPQHRLALPGAPLRLGPAKGFVDGARVLPDPDPPAGAYHHLLLDRHATLLSEGIVSESMLLGPMALACLGPSHRTEIARALGCAEVALPHSAPTHPCAPLLSVRRTREALAERACADPAR